LCGCHCFCGRRRRFRQKSTRGIDDIFQSNLRFDQIFIGAQSVGASLVFGLAERSQHNDFGSFESFGVAQNIQHLETANFGHHDIRNNKVWLFLGRNSQSGFPVAGGYYGVALSEHTRLVYLSEIVIVFDQQNLCHFYAYPYCYKANVCLNCTTTCGYS